MKTAIPGSRIVMCILLGTFAALLFILPSRNKAIQGVLQKLEWSSYDFRMKIRPEEVLDKRIRLVGVTDMDYYLSGDEIDSREAYALTLQALRKLDVHSVLIDILFEETRLYDSLLSFRMQELPVYIAYKFITKFSTEDLLKEYGIDLDQLQDKLARLTTEEEVCQRIREIQENIVRLKEQRAEYHKNAQFEDAAKTDLEIKKMEMIVSNTIQRLLKLKYAIRSAAGITRKPNEWNPYQAKEVVFPDASLLLSVDGFGYINVEKGTEEVVRRIPLVFSHDGTLYPHIDLIYLCEYYGVNPADLIIIPGKYIEFTPEKNGTTTKRIPIDKRGNFLINFRQGESFLVNRGVTLRHLIHYEIYGEKYRTVIEPESFKDAFILLGENNVGGTDTEPIPLQPGFPLIATHANVIDNILKDDYVRIVPSAMTSLIILLCGLILGIIFIATEYRKATIFSVLILLLYIAVAMYLFNSSSLVIPVVKPLGTLVLAYVLLIFYTVVIAEKEQRQVQRVFFKTVSPEIGQEILRQYNNEAIWGSKQRVTIMFVDIRGFTSVSESLSPERTVELVNIFYDNVSQVILEHGGQINKFIGDEVMALYGAPIKRDDAEAQAVLSAVEIQQRIATANVKIVKPRFNISMNVGIGINTGEVVVGTVGGRQTRIEYTALGDTVNIAARLQKQARAGQVFIGKETCELALRRHKAVFEQRNIELLNIPDMVLRGKQSSVEVFEVKYPQSPVAPTPDSKTLH